MKKDLRDVMVSNVRKGKVQSTGHVKIGDFETSVAFECTNQKDVLFDFPDNSLLEENLSKAELVLLKEKLWNEVGMQEIFNPFK